MTGAGKHGYPAEVEERDQDLPYMKAVCDFGMAVEYGLGASINAVVLLSVSLGRYLYVSSV